MKIALNFNVNFSGTRMLVVSFKDSRSPFHDDMEFRTRRCCHQCRGCVFWGGQRSNFNSCSEFTVKYRYIFFSGEVIQNTRAAAAACGCFIFIIIIYRVHNCNNNIKHSKCLNNELKITL